MSYIINQPAPAPYVLEDLEIVFIRDEFLTKRICAQLKGLQRVVVLWDGITEYQEAGEWTNETALQRAKDLIANNAIKFV